MVSPLKGIRAAHEAFQMFEVNPLGVASVRLLRTRRQLGLVLLEDFGQRQHLIDDGFGIQLAIGDQEDGEVSARWHFQPAAFNKTEILLQAGHAGFRLFVIVAADRVVELAATVAKGDAVKSGALFEPGHRDFLCKNPRFPVQRRDANPTATLPPKCPLFARSCDEGTFGDVPQVLGILVGYAVEMGGVKSWGSRI